VACFLYLEMARHLRAGFTPAEAYAHLCAAAPAQLRELRVPETEIAQFDYLLTGLLADFPEQMIRSGGYVLHTLEASLWCLLRYETFAETVLAAVNLGDDTDTTGAVAGGLAGLHYGEAAMPAEWLAVLARRADIDDLARRMAAGISC
jgi:ADP-ribosylglycohydrolase